MTTTIDISEAQAQLAELLDKLRDGIEIIIAQGSKPIARLSAITPQTAPEEQEKRVGNLNPGSIWISDDFDEPLPDEFWLGKK